MCVESEKVDDGFVQSEAYGRSDESYEVVLNFVNNEQLNESALFQNYPNPFSSETKLGFYLDRAGTTVLQIQDVSGRVVKRVQKYYEKGYHEVFLNRSELPQHGIYYYQLNTDWGYRASKKMIIQ